MLRIGLNTNIVKLIKSAGRPLIIGIILLLSITIVSLIIQYFSDLI